MNPPCAFCKKTVYPTEKFNCLDKIWHKGCFKCTECGLKLTMNTYKGYNKSPYCKAHYPHLTATQVATTVEGQRLKKQSAQQSQVEYHKKFNADKGSKMSVADDPETKRNMKVSNQQSLAQYHNRAGQKAQEEARRPSQGEDHAEPGYGGGGQRGYQPPPQQAAQPPQLPPMQQAYQPPAQPAYQPPAQPAYQPDPPAAPQPDYDPTPSPPPTGGGGSNLIQFKALYDYTAADDDEVSFQEDDIFQGSIVDEGWLEGTVVSTGQSGMAPKNYFEEM